MKKAAVLTAVLLVAGAFLAAHGEAPPDHGVAAEDLEAAGFAEPRVVEPEDDRFLPPVRYFRVDPSSAPLGNDCADCRDLVAVYVGESETVPAWFTNDSPPVRVMAGRVQVRRWLPARRLVITVTAPGQAEAGALSDLLVARFR